MTTWDSIGELARLAPTPHNTQPFRIVPRSETSADLVALAERFLPREDHGNLYVASSFGVFAAAIERAARRVGREVRVTMADAVDVGRLHETGRATLGLAAIVGTCPPSNDGLLEARRTSRLPYHDRTVPDVDIAQLTRIAEAFGHRLVTHSDPALVRDLLHLNADAIIDNLALDDEREEIRGWYRFGETPRFGDGLWQVPLNQPAWEIRAAFATPRLFGLPGFRQFGVHRYLKTQRGTRHVGFLSGPYERWPDLVRAGRMLMDFWVEMARLGIYMQPMGSMLTNAWYAAEVARRYSVDECWLVFRFGYSDVPPRAPRLESIVVGEQDLR